MGMLLKTIKATHFMIIFKINFQALTNDLIESTNQEHRQFCLSFYSKLIQGQYKDLSMMRTHFFRLIQNHNIPEDLSLRLDMLRSLTDDGKDIQNFEEEIGIFMLKWIPQIIEGKNDDSIVECSGS